MTQTSLQDRLPAESVFDTLRQLLPAEDTRGPVGRLFGVHPVPAEHRSWYLGAIGELAAARALAGLPHGFTVLHSVPVGDRGSDIDHVVITPQGRVVTINTKNHDGASVWVGSKAFLVNGQKQPYLQKSRYEAARASRRLTTAVGKPVDALGMILVVGAKSLTIKEESDDIAVIRLEHVAKFLTRRVNPPRLPTDVAAIRQAATRPATWTSTTLPARGDDLEKSFSVLRQRVNTARRRRLGWAAGSMTVLSGVLLTSGMLGMGAHLL